MTMYPMSINKLRRKIYPQRFREPFHDRLLYFFSGDLPAEFLSDRGDDVPTASAGNYLGFACGIIIQEDRAVLEEGAG
jgi:hypothetical protein